MMIFLLERVAGPLERAGKTEMDEEPLRCSGILPGLDPGFPHSVREGASSEGSDQRAALAGLYQGLPNPHTEVPGCLWVSQWFCCEGQPGMSQRLWPSYALIWQHEH